MRFTSRLASDPHPLARARCELTGVIRVGIYEQIFRMAWLTVPSLWATARSAASAPSTAAEFRAAGDASADASSAASDASKTADVPRKLCNNCTARRVCAPVLVVGLIGAIFFAIGMMAATSSPAEALELSTARGDGDSVTAQPDGFESTELMKGCVAGVIPRRGGGARTVE